MGRPKKIKEENQTDKEMDHAAQGEEFEVPQEAVAPVLTIKNLKELRLQWSANKLPPKVHVALRTKLLDLHKAGKAHADEEQMLWNMLKRERIQGTIGDAEGYILNAHEASECTEMCVVKADGIPGTHGLVKGAKMKFYYDGDKNKYNVYPVRVIPPDHQLDLATAKRIAAGITVDPATFPPAKELIRHLVLNDKEFERWFDVLSDELMAEEQKYEGLLVL